MAANFWRAISAAACKGLSRAFRSPLPPGLRSSTCAIRFSHNPRDRLHNPVTPAYKLAAKTVLQPFESR
jgi:hypothetical protein